jgi:hypothetical protein
MNETSGTGAAVELSVADRLEIHELPGRYGDAIDDRNWPALDRVFTSDAVFDLTGVGGRVCRGLADITAFMESEAAHPRTHLMTNIYVDLDASGVYLRSRIVALLREGRVGTASYYDTLVRTPEGWRIAHRVCSSKRLHKREAEVDRLGIAL